MIRLFGIALLIAVAIAAAMISFGYSWPRSFVVACLVVLVICGCFLGLLIYGGDH